MATYAAVEGGGTTWRVALAEGHPSNITEMQVFDTLEDPAEQLAVIRAWLDKRKFDALGIATFGPVDPRPGSSTYGYITTTPKPGWHNVDVVGALSDGSVPVQFDTDVNAPALAEYMWQGERGETSCAYITVGTGIGVGLVVNGAPVHGLLHPEAGHVCLQRMPGDTFAGTDELFGASVEGLAATPALAARKGCSRAELANLSDDDPIWEPAAHALAGLCATLVLVASPERIVLSGGVMNRKILYPMVRRKTQELLHGYIDHPKLTTSAIDHYISESAFGSRAGIVGALTLAHVARERAMAINQLKGGASNTEDVSSTLVKAAVKDVPGGKGRIQDGAKKGLKKDAKSCDACGGDCVNCGGNCGGGGMVCGAKCAQSGPLFIKKFARTYGVFTLTAVGILAIRSLTARATKQ